MMKSLLWCLLIIGFLTAAVPAQPELDTTFNSTGIQTVSFGINASARDVAIQPDNKIVVAGGCQPSNYYQCVARYNEDGSLDTTFAQQGFLVNFGLDSGMRVALQSDGKIVVGGSQRVDFTFPIYSIRVGLVRYTTDGVLDSSFGGGNVIFGAGMGLASPAAMAIQPDGKIAIVGGSTPWTQWPTPESMGWMARYLPDGTPGQVMGIASDGSVPITQTSCTSVTVQPDGKLLLGIRTSFSSTGYKLMRLNADGTVDTTWGGGDGVIVLPATSPQDSLKNLQIMPDGRVVGSIYNNLVRFNPDGSLDTTFDGDGIATMPGEPFDLAISASGRITATALTQNGISWKFGVYKFKADGSPETTFGNNGMIALDPIGNDANTSASACAYDMLGRTVVVGYATASPNRFTVVRLVAPPVMSVSVSGRVVDANGNGVANATVSTQGVSAQTSPFGYYTLNNVQTNRTYIFSVRARNGAAFTKRTILVDGHLTNIDFVGTAFDSGKIQIDEPAPKSAGPSIRKLS